MKFDENKMAEAEVTLRLALYLVKNNLTYGYISLAIDGAQIQTNNTIHFPMLEFLKENNFIKLDNTHPWRGNYKVNDCFINIHATSGKGDLVAKLKTGKTLYVESKKGSLSNSSSSQEYPLLREAIGQLVTMPDFSENYQLAVAVPYSPKFKDLTSKWTNLPLIKQIGISFLLIHRNGQVEGINF